jgi:hypothetical protein
MIRSILRFKTLIFLCFISISTKYSYASHIAGGEIIYTCIDTNQYQFNLNLYWDCTGGFDPGPSQTLNLTSSCGATLSLTVNQTASTDVTPTCVGVSSNCSPGGTFPGMRSAIYTGIITLSSCNTWTISYSSCCRNSAIDNVSGSNMYIEAKLNSTTAPNNNSPYFTAQPIPYICVNQTLNYNYGVIETDGDSLYYSIISALDGPGVPSTYYSGYSGTSPFPGITINPATGMLSFTPTSIGNYVVVVLVQEYNSNGDLVGSVMRDIQFLVQNCTNVIPDLSGGIITNFTGSAVQTSGSSIEICPGQNFSFDLIFTDADVSDSLSFQSDIATILPGATITTSGINPLSLNVTWSSTSSAGSGRFVFVINIRDDACPTYGEQSFAYIVNVEARTTAGADQTICLGQQAMLNASGGSSFIWSVLSGPAIIPGSNFSCTNCSNPVASPNSTTVYEVVSNLGAGCANKDTITISVVPDFTFDLQQSGSSVCINNPVQLNVINLTPSALGYTYQWIPSAYLNDSLIENPVATIFPAGNHNYEVTVTSPGGCKKSDSLSILVLPAYSPDPYVSASDTSVCAGTTIQLSANIWNSIPAVCGISSTGCPIGSSILVGTNNGANTSTSWPAPYGNWYTSQKHQMLFLATELNAAGIFGGKIDQIAMQITAISGITLYHQYTIKIGCTNLTALGTSWSGGLYQVFGPANVNIVVGWNTHVFDNAFDWDGISNVIVEVCSTEGPPYSNYTTNSVTPYTTTAFTSCIYSYTDAFDMCPDLTNWITPSYNRPIMRFHYCTAGTDTSSYIYSWSPGTGITDPNSQFTNAIVGGGTVYTVVVTDTVTGCSGSDSLQIDLCLSTPESEDHEISVYPTPSTDLIKVNNVYGTSLRYSLYDITGKQLVESKESGKALIEIDISPFEKGIYILRVNDKTYKIIKQ